MIKLPNWLKIIWWVLLAGFFAFLLYQRYDLIMSGDATAVDIVILLILIALLTIPLFQEVSIFGVGFKKEIDNLRTDFKEQIINLRSDVQNSISMTTNINPNINILTPPLDSELPAIKNEFDQELKRSGIKNQKITSEETPVPEDAVFLFKIRYMIEDELRRIWQQKESRELEWRVWMKSLKEILTEKRPLTNIQILHSLANAEIISPKLMSVIRDVFAVCNSAIHGEDISGAKVQFIREVFPEIAHSLLFIRARLEETNKE